MLLASYLNSSCTSKNHAAFASVLAGTVNVLSPHHAHEQDVAGSSAYMQKIVSGANKSAVHPIFKWQRRLTGIRIMSYSRVLHSKAPSCLDIATPCGGHPERAARLTSDLQHPPFPCSFFEQNSSVEKALNAVVDSGFNAGF